MKNKLVYIAHQVSGDVEGNIKKILELCHDIHKKNDNIIPFAPYVVSLHYLNDDLVEERELGILANQEHFERKTMDEVWICGPKISKGMEQEIKLARKYEIPIRVYSQELEDDLGSFLDK
jgi:hypothetical protein